MKRFINALTCLLGIHLAGLLLTTLLRVVLFVVGHSFLDAASAGNAALQLRAFLNGIWFDNVVGCYILALPLVVLLVCAICDRYSRWALRAAVVWMQLLWCIVLLASTANIPYFLYFFKNINASIWNWAEYGATTLGMLLGEPSYYPPLIAFVLLTVGFVWLTNRLFRHFVGKADVAASRYKFQWKAVALNLVCIGLCVLGIRGRLGYNPIKISAAYFCEDAFLNQLGVSPTFNLLRTSLDLMRPENRRLQLMDEDEAVELLKQGNWGNWDDGIAASADASTDSSLVAAPMKGKNVVLIFMESMSTDLTGVYDNGRHLTPFLDSLYTNSLHFSRCYSTGFHTNQGLFATLYSYPAILDRNMMKGTDIPKYEGLPTLLQKQGYRTMFFMSHEAQYDNMQAFFLTNGYSQIYSQADYPADKVVNSFGVQDDFLFDYAIRTIGQAQTEHQPFFATILSISNHPKYVIPEYFTPRSDAIEDQAVEYADWSLRQFFAAASREPWYANTVFVLVGDHGKLMGDAENEMPQSCNHVPLIIFTPGMTPCEYGGWTEQMDIAPTLLALMGQDFTSPFGQNVLKLRRPFAFYCMDDVMGVRSNDRLLIYRPSTQQEIKYTGADGVGDMKMTDATDSVFAAMKRYLFVNLQAADKLTREHH